MNLFAGAHVSVLIEDAELDAIFPESAPVLEPLGQILSKGDLLVRCRDCGRIAIENRATMEVAFFLPEPLPPDS